MSIRQKRFMEPGVNRDRFWCLSDSGESPLYLAAKRGRHGVVKAIVRSGSPRAKEAVELRDGIMGATPVFVAALHAHRKACRELAIHGRADLTSKPRCMMNFARYLPISASRRDKTSSRPDIVSISQWRRLLDCEAASRRCRAGSERPDELKRRAADEEQARTSSKRVGSLSGKGCSSIARPGSEGSLDGSCGK